MNVGLWIVQGLLALLFLLAGGMKLFAFDRYKTMAEQRSPERGLGLSKSLTAFIGASELAGGVGLVLPQATGTAPWLTPLAALGLAVIMVLAAIYHRRRGEPMAVTIGLFVLAFAVAIGRSI